MDGGNQADAHVISLLVLLTHWGSLAWESPACIPHESVHTAPCDTPNPMHRTQLLLQRDFFFFLVKKKKNDLLLQLKCLLFFPSFVDVFFVHFGTLRGEIKAPPQAIYIDTCTNHPTST